MGPFHYLYAALVGVFAFAAIYHLILWWSSRRESLLAVFAADCAARAALCGVLLALTTAASPEAAFDASRARIAIVMLTLVASLWSFRLISGVRAGWVVWPLTVALSTVFLVQVLFVPLNSTVVAVDRVVLPWGETVSSPRTENPGWWVGPLLLLGFTVQVFGAYCCVRLWARDRVAAALVLSATGGTVLIFVLEAFRAYLSFPAPVVGAAPHLLWVCVIALLIARAHRQTRDQLTASRQRFRGIFDQTFQFSGLLTTDGTLIEANRTALEFADVPKVNVIGMPFWDTPWWAHSAALRDQLREAIRDAAAGRTVRFEATHPRPDGRLAHVDFSLKPLRDDDGRVALLIPEGRDITERKGEEEARRALELQLAQSQKLETVGLLAAGVAHDFNNLLTIISGYCELLREMSPSSDTGAEMLEGIRVASVRAAALTRQLLTFSRKQVVEPRVIDLSATVAEAEPLLRRLVREDVALAVRLAPAPAPVLADAGQVTQVILNLAANARDAMPTGGTLTIETDAVELDAREAGRHRGARAGPYARLTVTDSGTGMTPEVQARLFEPFFTTKNPGKGTGLGLANVRTIAEESGGFLTVSGEEGRGSTFRLHLPALATSAPAERPPDTRTTPRGGETILLVEDDDAVRAVTRRMLELCGYTVVDARCGADAVRLSEGHSRRIDLLVTDVVMPEVGGRELAEVLLSSRRVSRVLFLSGYADDAVVRHGVRAAEVAFLQKPFTVDGLANKVRQALDAEPPPLPA